MTIKQHGGVFGRNPTFNDVSVEGDFSAATVSDLGVVTTADINGGTIDGATIATSDITVGSGKTLDVSAGTLTLASDQISGDSIEGGTIGSVTISSLTATSADIDGGTMDGVTINDSAIGGSTPAAGSFTTLNTSGAVVFNEAGADVDFRVEGDTDANLLFVDASADAVGIGTNSAGGKLTVLSDGSSANALRIEDSRAFSASPASAVVFRQKYNTAGNFASEAYIVGGKENATDGNQLGYLAFGTNNNSTTVERMRIDSSGNVGIGTTSPSNQLTVYRTDSGTSNGALLLDGDGNYAGVQFAASGTLRGSLAVDAADMYLTHGSGINFRTGSGNNIAGTTRMSIDSSGVSISGSLSKGSGSFKIDHPLKPETHHLVHSFVESPQADNIYRGKVDLVSGSATVNIDSVAGMTEGTFVALNREIQCFTSNESGWTAVRGSVSGNILTIEAQDSICTDTVSWMVIGERQDQHMYDTEWTDENGKVIVEPLKETENTEELE